MNSIWKLTLASTALVATTAFITVGVVAQEKKSDKKPEAMPPGMDKEMEEKMMKLAAPGDEHKSLMKHAGTWEQSFKFRMSPDAPWMDAKGTAVSKPILDGRYLLEEVEFDMMGMPMKGMQILGYDNLKKEYVSLWLDSGSTWPILARGKRDAKGVLETKGTMVDVAGERPFRMTIQDNADGTVDARMYDNIPPKGEVEMMQIHSKRKS